MISEITINEATEADIEIIARLAREIWPVSYKGVISGEQIEFMLEELYSEHALLAQMRNDKQRFIIMHQLSEAVGFASFSPLIKQNKYKINKLYVLTGKQMGGLGKILINATENKIMDTGSSEVILNVNRNNPAIGFYKKMGYKILKSEDIPIGPYWMNDYIMYKELANRLSDQNKM